MESANTTQPMPSGAEETVIVSVGAEGGGVELLGRRRAGDAWEFRRVMNDSSWAMLDEEIDHDRTVVIPAWVSTWDEAVLLLDRTPWAQPRPLAVHPAFRADVLVEVTRRLRDAPPTRRDERMAQWLAVCGNG